MALDGTATGLRASIAGWLNRTDLTAVIPDFITLAEAQMNRRLRVRKMLGSYSLPVAAEFENLPSDFAGTLTITLPDGTEPDYMTPDALAYQKWQWNSPSGTPKYFTIIGLQVQYLPAPATAITGLLSYYQKLPALSANASSWCLTDNPDAYLYGALVQSAPYLKNDERLQVWGTLFTTALSDIADADKTETLGRRLTPVATYTP